jgi:hypothetical protein
MSADRRERKKITAVKQPAPRRESRLRWRISTDLLARFGDSAPGGISMKTRDRAALLLAALAGTGAAALAYASETIAYTYDARGRLVKVVRTGNVNNNVSAEYKYDKADNRTNVNVVSPN